MSLAHGLKKTSTSIEEKDQENSERKPAQKKPFKQPEIEEDEESEDDSFEDSNEEEEDEDIEDSNEEEEDEDEIESNPKKTKKKVPEKKTKKEATPSSKKTANHDNSNNEIPLSYDPQKYPHFMFEGLKEKDAWIRCLIYHKAEKKLRTTEGLEEKQVTKVKKEAVFVFFRDVARYLGLGYREEAGLWKAWEHRIPPIIMKGHKVIKLQQPNVADKKQFEFVPIEAAMELLKMVLNKPKELLTILKSSKSGRTYSISKMDDYEKLKNILNEDRIPLVKAPSIKVPPAFSKGRGGTAPKGSQNVFLPKGNLTTDDCSKLFGALSVVQSYTNHESTLYTVTKKAKLEVAGLDVDDKLPKIVDDKSQKK